MKLGSLGKKKQSIQKIHSSCTGLQGTPSFRLRFSIAGKFRGWSWMILGSGGRYRCKMNAGYATDGTMWWCSSTRRSANLRWKGLIKNLRPLNIYIIMSSVKKLFKRTSLKARQLKSPPTWHCSTKNQIKSRNQSSLDQSATGKITKWPSSGSSC